MYLLVDATRQLDRDMFTRMVADSIWISLADEFTGLEPLIDELSPAKSNV